MHGFDLTFCAPKSVSLLRALRGDDVTAKAVLTPTPPRFRRPWSTSRARRLQPHPQPDHRGERPGSVAGVVAVAYQHETSRAGIRTCTPMCIVPNRQARADGALVSMDGTSLYHEASAAGVIYQATLRRELHLSLGVEWAPVDPSTGMAEIAGIHRDQRQRLVAALHPIT